MNPSQAEAVDDTGIIARILSGEVEQYAMIVRKYNAYLYRIGRSYGYNHADTEDLMQDTYVNAYMNLEKFENRASFKTWLGRIMLNQCYHKRQKFSFQKEKATLDTEKEEKSTPMFTNNHSDTGKTVLNNELNQVLEKALLHIPEDYRMVFTLRELNGLNVREASHVLDISEGNVKVKLNRAKHMLQSEIKKVYNPEDIFEFNLIYCDTMVERVMHAIRNPVTQTES